MKIKSGDTLSAIAKKNGTTIAKLLAANPNIKNANSIKVGQSLTMPKVAVNNNKTRGGGTYVGRNQLKDTNPYKDTDMKKLNKKPESTADAMTKAGEERKRIVKKYKGRGISTSSANPIPGRMEGGPPQTKSTKKKKSIGSKFMSFIKGEGSKMKKDFNNAVKETKRNFSGDYKKGTGKYKLVSEGTSNITNSSTYKKKVDKKKNLAMQKKQQSKKLKNQMST